MSNARDIANAGYRLAAFVRFNGAFDASSNSNQFILGAGIHSAFNVSYVVDQTTGQYRIYFATPFENDQYSAVISHIPDVIVTGTPYATSRFSFLKAYNAEWLEVASGYQDSANNGYLDYDISVAIFN